MYCGTTIYYSSCTANSLTLTLSNNRREWISSVQIQNYYSSSSNQWVTEFNLYGRNSDTDEWTLLTNVTGLTYSTPAQKRRIYFPNNTPYNQFKFENFATGNSSSCYWRVQSLDLFADNVLADIPNFTYDSSVTVFKDVEMVEVIPQNADRYMNFRVSPAFPAGIVLDRYSGWISGTATSESAVQTYTITATKISGGDVTDTISLSVSVCTGGKGLMTVRFYADSYKSENSWKLYEGRGTSGTVLRSVDVFPVKSAYYYVDFCLNDGIYTFEGADSFGDGWENGSGYTLTVDYGEMELDIMEMDTGVKPVYVSSVFSTYFPFQIEYTDWKVIQSDVSSDWNTVSFDDSTWNTYKAAVIPSTSSITTYIRKSFTMSGVNDYQVLNVRVKYSGGVAAYLNGNVVARFNLEDDFDSTSLSITDHDSTVFSKFHVILSTAGIQEGSNVFSFEIHRGLSGSSSDAVVFDATGVFGVDDCSTVVDSYSSITSTELESGTLAGIMDLDPYTYGVLPNTIGTYIDWTVENLEGSKWNSFNIVGATTVSSWGFDINAIHHIDDTVVGPVTILNAMNQRVVSRTKPQIAVPVALAGFRRYRWQVTKASSTTVLGSVHTAYCKPTGSVCPSIDSYPSVGEGQISPSSCPEGYSGYSYRECSGGVLGEVKMDHCVFFTRIYLPSSSYSFLIHQSISFTIDMNNVTNCIITPSLPQGLILDISSCTVSGTFTSSFFSSYTVTAISDSNTFIRIVSIEIISSLISYPQTNLIIGQGLSFSITPNLTKVSTISIVSGSLPIGLSINPSTGVISGSPSQLLSSQSVTIEAMSGTAIQTVVLSFTVITPISSFSYSQSSYVISKNHPFSIIPTVDGDDLSFSIISGSLPIGLSLNSITGVISGSPSQSIISQSVTIKAFNQVSDQTISLIFMVLASITSFSYSQSSYVLTKNNPFSIMPSVDGNDLSFSIISGSLPVGLSLNPSTGVISGSPSQSVISQSVTIKAFNQVSDRSFSITFTILTPISSFAYPQSSYILSAGVSFSVSPTVNGDDLSFSITSGSLPNGLSLNPSTGVISGTPSLFILLQSVTIKASNEVSDQSFSLSFTVLQSISLFSYPQSFYVLSKNSPFSATPSITGDGLSFSITSGSLPIGLSLNPSTGVISGSPSQFVISHSVTIKAFNQVSDLSVTLTFTVLTSITSFSYPQTVYVLAKDQSFSVTPIVDGDDLSFSITSGALPTGLTLNESTGVISGIPSQSVISQSVTIKVSNEVSDRSFSLSFTVLTPISSFSYPQSSYVLSKNHPFSVSPSVNGDGLSFSIISGSLPIGLSLNPSNGVISGIPSQSTSSQSLTIKAFNEVSNQSFSLSFTVLQSITSFSYSQSSYVLSRNESFSTTPSVNGDDLLFSITSGSLPIGLLLNSTTGVISGIPSQSVSSQSVTIKASNELSDRSFSISFTVLTPISSFSYPQSSYVLSKNESFSITPSVNGDDLSFTISSGSFPVGLFLNSTTGVISGSPSQSVISQSVTIKASNQVSNQSFSILFTILTPITSFNYPQSSLILSTGESCSIPPSVNGDDLSFSIIIGSLPTGLNLNPSTGVISGSPSQFVIMQSVTIKASNDVSDRSFSLSFTILQSISSFSYPQSSFVLAKNSSFSVTPSITGDGLSFSITSGSLPIGLSLDSSSGIIFGSPSQFVLSQSVTINAHNQVSDRFVILTFSILTPITSFSYSHSSIALSKNESFSFSPTVDGDDLSFSISSGFLPIGLSLNSTTGIISGTPSQSVLSQSVTIKAFNEVSNRSFSLSFTVLTPISSFSYSQSFYVLSIDESFSVIPTVDGDELSFSISSGYLPIGLSINSTTGIISGTPSQSVKSQSIIIKALNEVSDQSFSLSFTILQSITSFSYPQSSYVLSKNDPVSITPSVNGDELSFSITSGSLLIGLSLNLSNGMISGIPSQFVISQSITIKASNEVSNRLFSLSFTVLTPISSFSYSQSSYVLSIDESFSIIPTVNGDGLSFSITSGSLPLGLILDSTTGMISGILSQSVSSQSVTIKASNELSGRLYPLSFSVLIPISSFSYPQTYYILAVGEDYSASPEIQATNPFFSISSGSLPIGLSLNPTTGLISGIPSQSVSSLLVTIKVSNELSDQSFSITFTIITRISSFSYPQSSYVLSIYKSFSVIPTVDGDGHFFISSGSLPIGLSLNPSSGMISGTPSTAIESTSLTVEVCNLIGCTQTQLSFSVKALSSLSILLISLAVLILIIVVIGIIRKKSHMHLYRKRGSRKLPISYPTKLNHTPQTEKPSISVDNPPNMLSNITVYDPPTPSHSS
ncbi:hypothetical protein JH06_5775 [Blastocystis sp. subtype 4]|uniref:hypothetical protein n=1 Tax=Blastocystis sp. subtype 4 TaxID=944170 RepID=UPI0007119E35|nr:hypothetical protein JH06_5775 [Blastocystis sp. subtype 4]KNB46235.1 hypothetical protein JH06_5775 [Blastocystis sp. subtype 4]|eukprot:XP_014529714.1 hypothetical protein JH06_5775 [Blastocystis sp. subtype 4]